MIDIEFGTVPFSRSYWATRLPPPAGRCLSSLPLSLPSPLTLSPFSLSVRLSLFSLALSVSLHLKMSIKEKIFFRRYHKSNVSLVIVLSEIKDLHVEKPQLKGFPFFVDWAQSTS